MTNETRTRAVVEIIKAVYEAIQIAGPAGIPRGHLYTALMPYGCTMENYNIIERVLLETGRVRREGQVLYVVAN